MNRHQIRRHVTGYRRPLDRGKLLAVLFLFALAGVVALGWC